MDLNDFEIGLVHRAMILLVLIKSNSIISTIRTEIIIVAKTSMITSTQSTRTMSINKTKRRKLLSLGRRGVNFLTPLNF